MKKRRAGAVQEFGRTGFFLFRPRRSVPARSTSHAGRRIYRRNRTSLGAAAVTDAWTSAPRGPSPGRADTRATLSHKQPGRGGTHQSRVHVVGPPKRSLITPHAASCVARVSHTPGRTPDSIVRPVAGKVLKIFSVFVIHRVHLCFMGILHVSSVASTISTLQGRLPLLSFANATT